MKSRSAELAEGVETPEQEEILHRLNCDEIQGYLFSKPLPRDELSAMLTAILGARIIIRCSTCPPL